MNTPRRFLPSLPLLTAFEAAARTGSITQAARELSLTGSAVSRQIKALEEQLGVTLFVRDRQSITLTLGGQSYAREVRDALARISSASMNLRASPAGALTLGVAAGFAARWLVPRLPDFLAAHPGVMVNVLTRPSAFEFDRGIVDAAIRYGLPAPGNAHAEMLRGETVLPLCAPGFSARHAISTPADLRRAPLLHLTTRPDAWERWLRLYGQDDHGVQGMLFDQIPVLAEAAAAGLGAALLPVFQMRDELARGRLVPALPLPYRDSEAYYLCWPQNRHDYGPLQIFRRWIAAEIARDPAREEDAPAPGLFGFVQA